MTNNKERFLTIEDCAREARTSPASIRHWLRKGLRSIRPGRRRLIERTDFEAFLASETNSDRGDK